MFTSMKLGLFYRIPFAVVFVFAACDMDGSGSGSNPADGRTTDSASGVLRGDALDNVRIVPVVVSSSTPAVIYVSMTEFNSEALREADGNSDEFDGRIRDDLRIYTDQEGVSWSRIGDASLSTVLLEFAGVFDRILHPVEDERIRAFASDNCIQPCRLRFRATFTDPGSTRDGAEYWEESPDLWLETELQYEKLERVDLTRLLELDEQTGNGVVALGAVLLQIDAASLTATLGTTDVAVWHPRRSGSATDTGLDAGPTVRESADGTRTEVPRE